MESDDNCAGTTSAVGGPDEHVAFRTNRSERFKLLLVHNLGQSFQEQIADLRACGLPAATEARMLSIAQPVYGPIPCELIGSVDQERNSGVLHRLNLAARQARAELTAAFPTWEIHDATSPYSGAALIELAQGWQPDLVSCGAPLWTQNRSFRSLFRTLVSEFHCAVRVVRPPLGLWPFRRPLVVAFEGPESASAILRALTRRRPPSESPMQLVFCTGSLIPEIMRASDGCAEPDKEIVAGQLLRMQSSLESLGFAVNPIPRIADSVRALVDAAGSFNAACILCGTRYRTILDDLAAGSTAAEIAARAPCSVEVLGPPRPQQSAIRSRPPQRELACASLERPLQMS